MNTFIIKALPLRKNCGCWTGEHNDNELSLQRFTDQANQTIIEVTWQ
jgi:hypothetical protein